MASCSSTDAAAPVPYKDPAIGIWAGYYPEWDSYSNSYHRAYLIFDTRAVSPDIEKVELAVGLGETGHGCGEQPFTVGLYKGTWTGVMPSAPGDWNAYGEPIALGFVPDESITVSLDSSDIVAGGYTKMVAMSNRDSICALSTCDSPEGDINTLKETCGGGFSLHIWSRGYDHNKGSAHDSEAVESEPVNIVNGNMYIIRTDLSTPSPGMPFT